MHDAAFMDCNKAIWQYKRNIPGLIIMDKVSQNVNEQLCKKPKVLIMVNVSI